MDMLDPLPNLWWSIHLVLVIRSTVWRCHVLDPLSYCLRAVASETRMTKKWLKEPECDFDITASLRRPCSNLTSLVSSLSPPVLCL